jgi:hypothetical protein
MMVLLVLWVRKAAGAVMQMKAAGNVSTAVMGGCCDARLV